MKLSDQPLFTASQIDARIGELADEISKDLAGRDVVLLVVLKGALHTGSDLMRKLSIPITLDFVRAKSYAGTESSGVVDFLLLPRVDLRDKHVVVVEDILDSGRTARVIADYVRSQDAASQCFLTLFNKSENRQASVTAEYVGFEISGHFIVGYGMDYDEQFRQLPDVYALEE